MYQPLADELRPTTLDDVYGQEEILGEGRMLRRMIESGRVPNLIFYGPSGTGKTTVANIIAAATQRTLYKLNATTASTADIREIVSQLDTFMAPNGVLLYLDEIQSFNKKQQQSLLEHIENGKITLIASTTENPYFYIFNAILSRCTVFEFKPITPAAAEKAVRRAVRYMAEKEQLEVTAEPGALEHIASSCGGDIRKALNAVEALFLVARTGDTSLHIRLEDAKAVTQRSAMRYDREGDNHYDCLSALMKSIRGSDPDAAIHYLARFLEVGDLPACCRRLLCSAAEDIGLAYPQAIPIVKACVDSALQLGMPSCRAIPIVKACVDRAPPLGMPEARRPLWRRPRNPIPACWPSTPRWRTSGTEKPASSRASCRTSTPTAPGRSASRAISTRTISRTTGSRSSTCRTC